MTQARLDQRRFVWGVCIGVGWEVGENKMRSVYCDRKKMVLLGKKIEVLKLLQILLP